MSQSPNARLQAQRDQLKSQLEGFLTQGHVALAQERIEALCAKGHARHVRWALERIDQPEAKALLDRVNAQYPPDKDRPTSLFTQQAALYICTQQPP